MIEVEVQIVPVSYELGLAIAIAENDHDVAGGIALSGWELDLVEQIEREIEQMLDRAVLWGE